MISDILFGAKDIYSICELLGLSHKNISKDNVIINFKMYQVQYLIKWPQFGVQFIDVSLYFQLCYLFVQFLYNVFSP